MTIDPQAAHNEHQDWLNDLTAWHNELVYYDRVLLRLLQNTVDNRDTDRIEEFKSRFDILQEQLTQARDEVLSHEHRLSEAHGLNGRLHNHEQVRSQVRKFKEEFRKLKDEFYDFEESIHFVQSAKGE